MKIFGRNPTLWIGLIASAVILAGTLGFHWLTGQQAALIVAAINALAGAANAYLVRPIAPAAFTYAVGAIVAVVGAYGYNISLDTLAGINALVIAVLVLITRDQVSPQESPLTKA